MKHLYGSLQNRLMENRMFCETIKVGTGVTEYGYTDRHPYEVIEVKDQKHVTVRKLDHVHVGNGYMDNNWKLISNPENPSRRLERRGDVWYWTATVTADDIKDVDKDVDWKLRLCLGGWDLQKIREKGKQTKRQKANVSFGGAEYYYDYEF